MQNRGKHRPIFIGRKVKIMALSKVAKMNQIAETRLDEIKTELRKLKAQLEAEENQEEAASREVADAIGCGNIDAIKAAKAKQRDHKDTIDAIESRIARINSGALIDTGIADTAKAAVIAEIEALKNDTYKKAAKLIDELISLSQEYEAKTSEASSSYNLFVQRMKLTQENYSSTISFDCSLPALCRDICRNVTRFEAITGKKPQ